MGNNTLTRLLLSLSTTWFAINILMAPYSAGMRQDTSKPSHSATIVR